MRCKKHPSDLSSSVGVCASCLRERLFALIAAQAQAQAQQQQQQQQQQEPPPLVFPRSVSPYVTRRKSDNPHDHHRCRFYSTPQVGPPYNGSSAFSTTCNFASCKKKNCRLSLFSSLLGSRSDKCNSDPRGSCESSSSSASSWFFSAIFPSRRKKKAKPCYLDEDAVPNGRRDCRISNRGMSPAREMESDDDCDRSPSGSGYSTEEWRKTPMSAAPAIRRTRTAHNKSVSAGLAFCLSPLVRASPNRHWNQKGGLPPDLAYSGEIRGSGGRPHLSAAASFCANRSRKLADFGRVNRNR